MRRREVLKRAALAGIALPIEGGQAVAYRADAVKTDATPAKPDDPLPEGIDVRQAWVARLTRMAEPVLSHLAAGTLKRSMAVEGGPDRRAVTHLEALGRTLAGVAPWIELPADGTVEGRTRGRFAGMAADALRQATDPTSPDALNFTEGGQPLVDAAFLAHAIVRAPRALWGALDASVQGRVVTALAATRRITPGYNNWLLFSAMVEAALCRAGEPWDQMRVDYALRQHEAWYKGDGVYGDGPAFHWDYYNSFVIQPMLLDVLAVCGDAREGWLAMRAGIVARARRYAAIQERLVAPDGSFPADRPITGLSLRCVSAARAGSTPAGTAARRPAGAGTCRARRRHPPDARPAGNIRPLWLAADRAMWSPTCAWRALHLDRQPLPGDDRLSAAWHAGGRSVLGRTGPVVDRPPCVEWGAGRD